MLEKDKTKKRVERHDDTQEDFTPIGVVNSMLDQYPKEAFKDMKKLATLTIGKNVAKIGASAFEGCEKLKTVTIKNDKLKKALVKAMKANKLEEFLRAHGCDATAEEVQEFIETKAAADAPIELSDEELKYVAGGSFVDSVECSHKGNTCNCSNSCIRDCC